MLSPEAGTLNYRFRHVVTANDPPGDVNFTVSMEDLVGNTSTGLLVGKAQVDSSLPGVVNGVINPSRAKAGAIVTRYGCAKAGGWPCAKAGGWPCAKAGECDENLDRA